MLTVAHEEASEWYKGGETLRLGSHLSSRRALMKHMPKVIPPRSRVRLVRADMRTPTWRKDVGRQFRVGYHSRKDGLGRIWLVNENGKYEQTTDRDFLLKYFEIERLSREKNFYGVGKRRLGKILVRSALERLNGT